MAFQLVPSLSFSPSVLTEPPAKPWMCSSSSFFPSLLYTMLLLFPFWKVAVEDFRDWCKGEGRKERKKASIFICTLSFLLFRLQFALRLEGEKKERRPLLTTEKTDGRTDEHVHRSLVVGSRWTKDPLLHTRTSLKFFSLDWHTSIRIYIYTVQEEKCV